MTDLAQRLTAAAETARVSQFGAPASICIEARDAIRNLRAEIQGLKEWLDHYKARDEVGSKEIQRLREDIRAMELSVDGLNTKAYRQKPETQKTLDYIKSRCRDALSP